MKSYALSLEGFAQHGSRRAVYEAMLAALESANRHAWRQTLEAALAVAGFGAHATATLAHYWPGADHTPLFAQPRDYLPRLLALAATSPAPRVRAFAVHLLPSLPRAEFQTWGFDDTRLPLPLRLIVAAKLGEPELFGVMLAELECRMAEIRNCVFVSAPLPYHDYYVGPEGPFIYSPCAGKGDRSQRISAEQFYLGLTLPSDLAEEDYRARNRVIFQGYPSDQLDLRYGPGAE